MKPLTTEEIEAELRTLTQKYVALAGLFGLFVGTLEKDATSVQFVTKLSSLVDQVKPLSPTIPESEWNELLRIVSYFSTISSSHDPRHL